MRRAIAFQFLLMLIIPSAVGGLPPAVAGGKSQVARELLESVGGKWSRSGSVAQRGVRRRTDELGGKFGPDGAAALAKANPATVARWAQAAKPHETEVIKLFARHGDEATWIVSRPQRLAIFVQHGDDAATAMLRHREIIEPLLRAHGRPAAGALAKVNPRNGRRIVMLDRDGDLARGGRADELLAVIGKHGDRGMEFLWKHKGVLAGGAMLAAFLSDPEPFIAGTRQLGGQAIETVAAPLARTAANRVNWNAVIAIGMLGGTAWWCRHGLVRRSRSHAGD